ncbi:MAG TPA: ABC transporter permease [Vicinamibacteria bacterium]|nr:ABC transporter permease [Vicinamibacteria bacterium]
MIEILWQDVRYGYRMLRAAPVVALTAISSLALGIGANSSMFAVVHAALFRPLPVDSPEELWFLFTGTEESPYDSISYPDYLDYRDRTEVFQSLSAFGEIAVSLGGDSAPEICRGLIVTGNFFETLGLRPQQGRLLTPEDDRVPGEHPVAVLGDGLWRRRFGAEVSVVGRIITLNGRTYHVVGVAPRGFRGPDVLESYDIYVPMMMQAYLRPPRGGFSGEMDPDLLDRRNASWLRVVGRLRSDRSPDEAAIAVGTLARQLERVYPDTNEGESATVFPVEKVDPRAWPWLSSVSVLLMAVVGLVLLVATANVTSLLLARAVSRRREIALRLALGGAKARLVRQLLTESLLLSVLGGALGLLLASWALHGFTRLVPEAGIFSFTLDFRVDLEVVLFTFLVSVVTAALVGLAPALRSCRGELAKTLKHTDGAEGLRGRFAGRKALVLAQLALSIVLLVVAGLFSKSFWNSRAAAPGFRAHEVLTAPLRIDLLRYTKTDGRNLYRDVLERARVLPGVVSASLARVVPLEGGGRTTTFRLEGSPEIGPEWDAERLPVVGTNVIAVDYFRTMGISLLEGRDFSDRDIEDAPFVVVINETFAKRFFPAVDALGKRIRLGGDESSRTIVGVVSDSKYRTVGEPATPHVYQPLAQVHETGMRLLMRTAVSPEALVPPLRNLLLSLEPNLPVSDIVPLERLVRSALFPARMAAGLMTVFAVLASSLAAFGLYGLMSFAVAQRSREMGIRVALGASPAQLVRLVVGDGLWLVTVGVVLGWAGAAAMSRFLAGFLYGVSPIDPITFGSVALLLSLVMLTAAYVPALRAGRSDPLIALRYE